MPESKKVLFTRPEHDKVTNYLSKWCHEVIIFADKNGVDYKDLGVGEVTKKNLEKYIKKQNPKLVLLNGHGKPDAIGGHNNEIILEVDKNEIALKDKIVYAIACECGQLLGPALIKKGAKAFIGYDLPFCFLTNKNKTCTPEEDELANHFKEPSNVVSTSLIKGNTVKEAYDKSQGKFKELIRQLGTSKALLEAKDIRRWLFWDMRAQVALGDMNASY